MEKLLDNPERQMYKAFATSDFYQLLSLSIQWPNKALAEALLNGSYQNDAVNILEELGCTREQIQHVAERFEDLKTDALELDELLSVMSKEYTRLFNHPEQPVINIYESLFTSKAKEDLVLFVNPTALDVERCYTKAGVHLTNTTMEPADHMATELEFMMYLYGNKGIALKEHDQEKTEKFNKSITNFEKLHFAKWAEPFFNRLEQESEVSAYQAIAGLAKAGLNEAIMIKA